MKIGQHIKQQRLSQNRGLRELARMINVNASYLCNIEKGKKKPSKNILIKIANVLDLDSNYLILLSGQIPNQEKLIKYMLNEYKPL